MLARRLADECGLVILQAGRASTNVTSGHGQASSTFSPLASPASVDRLSSGGMESVEVSDSHISIATLSEFILQLFNIAPPSVEGTITVHSNDSIEFVLYDTRGGDFSPQSIRTVGSLNDIQSLLRNAAIKLIEFYDRYLASSFYFYQNDYYRSLRLARSCFVSFPRRAVSNRDSALVHTMIGLNKLSMGDAGDALSSLQLALSADSTCANAYVCRGYIRSTYFNDMSSGAEDYKAAIKLDPNLANAYNLLGIIYHKEMKMDSAVAMWEHAVSLDGKLATAHNNLGLYYAKGDFDLAYGHYKDALELQPDDEDFAYNLADLFFQHSKYDSALAYYDLARSIVIEKTKSGQKTIAKRDDDLLAIKNAMSAARERMRQH
jgi:tetratricopeptide (TPR) repeat protein